MISIRQVVKVFLYALSPLQSAIHRWVLLCLFTSLSMHSMQTGAQAPAAPKPSDVRVVIDISGSMKKNDPQNLRRPALDMLVKLLPEGSKAGVWTFGQYVNMLVKHRPVNGEWKQEADAKQQSINSVAQFTNVGEALEQAAYDKRYAINDQFQTHIILLTDGMVDINRDPAMNTKERNRILNEVLPVYTEAGYTIHTISLSDNADKKLMDRLALATNGKSAVAKTADELMNVFLQVFDQAVPKEELPLEGNTFATDSSIEEFTALIFRKSGSAETRLLTPDQKDYNSSTVDPNLNWYRTDKYDLITIKQPLEGEWRVLAELEPQSRITVVSDLSVAVKPLPTNLMTKDNVALSLALREDNKVVNRAEFLELLDITVDVNHVEASKQWSQSLSEGLVPGNGVYKTDLDYFSNTGTYNIAVTVDGKSFKRRYKHQLNVRDPFAIETDTINQDGKTQFKVTVIPQNQSIQFDKTEVVGKLKDPLGSSQIKYFTVTDEQVWEHLLTPEAEGIYTLTLRITTTNERGEAKDFIPTPLSFKYPQADSVFEALVNEEPSPIVSPPAPVEEEIKEEPVIDEPPAEQPPETGYTQWILYAILGIVNVLIVLVIYILYRKLFGASPKADDEAPEETAAEVDADDTAAPPAFEEPPMDEMVIDDLSDDDIDLAEEPPAEPELDLASEDEDPLADLSPEALDDDDAGTDDEDPEFSLDDFAPDALDDDEDKNN